MDIGSRGAGRDDLLDGLESDFSKFVGVGRVQETNASDGVDDSDSEVGYEDHKLHAPVPGKMGLDKSPAFPSPNQMKSCLASSEEEDDDDPETALRLLFSEESSQAACSSSVSLPLVSAMKGSREKQGLSPRKLSVKWAPDVYDPVPNSMSHTVKGKQKKSRNRDKDNHYNKKYGKKGQKGKASRGGSGKDKKQLHKPVRSDKCYRSLDASDNLPGELGDFGVGNPDYCGSSFLKNSITNFHYSLAEAL